MPRPPRTGSVKGLPTDEIHLLHPEREQLIPLIDPQMLKLLHVADPLCSNCGGSG